MESVDIELGRFCLVRPAGAGPWLRHDRLMGVRRAGVTVALACAGGGVACGVGMHWLAGPIGCLAEKCQDYKEKTYWDSSHQWLRR